MFELFKFLGAISTSGVVLSYLGKKYIQYFFKTREKAFEIETQAIASRNLEEHKVRFSKFHIERANFLKEIYQQMQLFLRCTSESVICSSAEVTEKLKQASVHYQNFHELFIVNKILINEPLEEIIAQFIDAGQSLIQDAVAIDQRMPNRPVDMTRLRLLNAQIRTRIESIIKRIETEFRAVLQ